MGRRKAIEEKSPKEQHALAMYASGMSYQKIADELNVTLNGVRGCIQRNSDDLEEIKHIKQNLGNDFLLIMDKISKIQHKVLDSITDEDINSLKAKEKGPFLRDLSVSKGTEFDKRQLHEGKATSNVQSILMVSQVDAHNSHKQSLTQGRQTEDKGQDE